MQPVRLAQKLGVMLFDVCDPRMRLAERFLSYAERSLEERLSQIVSLLSDIQSSQIFEFGGDTGMFVPASSLPIFNASIKTGSICAYSLNLQYRSASLVKRSATDG